jgi:hypothetical protein
MNTRPFDQGICDVDGSRLRLFETGDQSQKCRLAASGTTEKTVHFTAPYREVTTFNNRRSSRVSEFEIGDLQY